MNGSRSSGVEWSDELHEVSLALVLDLLLLHAQVVIIAVIGVDYHLVQVSDDADLGIGLHVTLAPLLQLCLLDVHLVFVHDFVVDLLVLALALDLAVLGVLDELQHVVALQDDFLLLLAAHVVAEDLGNDLSVEHLFELGEGVLVLAAVISEEGVELLLVQGLDVGCADLAVRGLDSFFLDLSEIFLEVGKVGGGGKEHEEILVDILEAAVDIGSELPDQFGAHVVLHPEEGEEFSEVIDAVEGSFLLELLAHVLLTVLVGSRLIGTQGLCDL